MERRDTRACLVPKSHLFVGLGTTATAQPTRSAEDRFVALTGRSLGPP